MAKCKACGTYLTDSMFACPECGLPRLIGTFKTIPTARGRKEKKEEDEIDSSNVKERAATHVSVRDVEPISGRNSDVVYSTPEERRVLSPNAYLSTLTAMTIPVIGLIFQIYWGYRYSDNYNRRNLARAYLKISAVFHAAAIAFAIYYFLIRR